MPRSLLSRDLLESPHLQLHPQEPQVPEPLELALALLPIGVSAVGQDTLAPPLVRARILALIPVPITRNVCKLANL